MKSYLGKLLPQMWLKSRTTYLTKIKRVTNKVIMDEEQDPADAQALPKFACGMFARKFTRILTNASSGILKPQKA